jgi:hypothetical protein
MPGEVGSNAHDAGEIDVPVNSHTYNWKTGAGYSWTTHRRPRLPVDVVARGRPGSALLVVGAGVADLGLVDTWALLRTGRAPNARDIQK